jgi:hypothetical protein
MGLGDKLAASIGLVPGWTSWQSSLIGTFAEFALGHGVSQDAETRVGWRARAILLV